MAEIDTFFMNPSTPPALPGTYSLLYHLRRDISACFGIDPNNGQQLPAQALLTGVMAICAGISLLGKFFAGEDSDGEEGSRFRGLLTQCSGTPVYNSEVIYRLKRGLINSFGLYSELTTHSGQVIGIYIFILERGRGTLVTELGDDTYLIDIDELRAEFEKAIEAYKVRLRADATLQRNIAYMLPKHQGFRAW